MEKFLCREFLSFAEYIHNDTCTFLSIGWVENAKKKLNTLCIKNWWDTDYSHVARSYFALTIFQI